MADRSAVPSDIFPHVLCFLRENRLLSAAREFTKATGVKDQDPNAVSLLDIFNNWLNSPGAKKRTLMSNGPSVTKKAKKDSSSSDACSSEEGEPMVKRPGGKSPTATQKESNRKATKSSSNSSDDDSSPEKKTPTKKIEPSNSAVDKSAACTPKIPCSKRIPTKVKESSSSDDSSDSLENEKAPVKSKGKSGPYSAVPPPYLQCKNVALEVVIVKKSLVAIKKTDSSDSSDSSDEESSSKKITQPGKASLTKLPAEQKTALKKAESSSDSSDSSSEEYEVKSKLSTKPLQTKAMVKPVPKKTTKAKPVSSSSDECTESDSSEDDTPAKIGAKAPTAKSLVTKSKLFLASTKRVKRSTDSNSSLSDSEVEKVKSAKRTAKVFLPGPVQDFMGKKKIVAAPKDNSSDSDTSSTDADDTCNSAEKHKALAVGKSPASTTGMSPPAPTKSFPPKKAPASSSSTSDSSSEEEQSKKAVPAKQVKFNSAKKAKSSSSSDDGSDSETEPEKKSVPFISSPRTAAVSSNKKKAAKKDNHDNDSSNSENEKSLGKKVSASTPRTATLKSKVPEKNGESSEESSSSEEQVNVLSTGKSLKKRKTEAFSGNQNGKERRTPDHKALPQTPNTFPKVNAKKPRLAEPFRRVRDEEIEVDFRVANNSFDAKRGAKGDWGEKANNILKFTKGKSFRHEKTKKKRGSYCGGAISTSVNSIKFDSE